jgi:hypothetical protein
MTFIASTFPTAKESRNSGTTGTSPISQQLTLKLQVELDWNWPEPISFKFHQVPAQFHPEFQRNVLILLSSSVSSAISCCKAVRPLSD